MSNSSLLLTGLATWLAGAGLGLTYNPEGVYTAGQTGIFMKHVPTTPDRVLILNAVFQSDNVTMPLDSVMVQMRGRGLPNKPLDVDELLDSVFDFAHNTTGLVLPGGLVIAQMLRKVSAPDGMDEASRRWSRFDQYYIDLDVPPTINRPTGGSW